MKTYTDLEIKEMIKNIEFTLSDLKDGINIKPNIIENNENNNLTFLSLQKMFKMSFNDLEELFCTNKEFKSKFQLITNIRIEAYEVDFI